jgi:preprotein translocase subunit SecD
MTLRWAAALSALAVLPSTLAAAGPLTLIVERAFVGEAAGSGEPVLDLQLAPQSAKEFGDLTAAHVGKVVELRIDGKVVFAPTVRDPIRSGDVEISGQFSRLELLEAANRIWRGTATVDAAPRD